MGKPWNESTISKTMIVPYDFLEFAKEKKNPCLRLNTSVRYFADRAPPGAAYSMILSAI
jgi:hypothetical protein